MHCRGLSIEGYGQPKGCIVSLLQHLDNTVNPKSKHEGGFWRVFLLPKWCIQCKIIVLLQWKLYRYSLTRVANIKIKNNQNLYMKNILFIKHVLAKCQMIQPMK